MTLKNRQQAVLGTDYELLDSGELMKLERFGTKTIARPSSLALWKKNLSTKDWQKADAVYSPGNEGWSFKSKSFEEWQVKFSSCDFKLRLQSNGQVGIFPEHTSYFHLLQEHLRSCKNQNNESPKMLSLFAFTGLATVVMAKEGADVCHVDSSKKALDWANQNVALNNIPSEQVRFIPEDALQFLRREVRRKNNYDIVMLDPPSFSRGNKQDAWQLENIIFEFIELCIALVESKKGMIVFSCHLQAFQSLVLKNIFNDYISKGLQIIDSEDLFIEESSRSNRMPCGSYLIAKM